MHVFPHGLCCVHQDIHRPELLHRCCHRGFHLIAPADIAGDWESAGTDRLDFVGGPLTGALLYVGQDDRGALLGQSQSHPAAYALPRSCRNGYLAVQFPHLLVTSASRSI
jgi:hypothetical protein